jgi:parallel beta-helix repeat protein
MARLTSAGFGLLAIVVAAMVSTAAAELVEPSAEELAALEARSEPPPPLQEPVELKEMPGIIMGTGTTFEVTDSEYLNVALVSTEPIDLRLESIPSIVTMQVEGASSTASTQITLSGLAPATTYRKYTDSPQNLEELVSDETGSCRFTLDLSEPRFVFIEPTPSTIYVAEAGQLTSSTIYLTPAGWSDPSVGTWDEATLTGTLTTDVEVTAEVPWAILIQGDGITLDGNGHRVAGAGVGIGIYASESAGVTVTNVNVQDFTLGLRLELSTDCRLSNNTLSNNYYGIQLYGMQQCELLENTASNNYLGIQLYGTRYTHLSGNTASGGAYGIYLNGSLDNTLVDNTVSDNVFGLYLYRYSIINALTNNVATANSHGIHLNDHSYNNTLTGNAVSSNSYGIYMRIHSRANSLIENTVTGNNLYGIYVELYSHSQLIERNTISNNGTGLYFFRSLYNTVSNNLVRQNGTAIRADAFTANTVSDNDLSFNGGAGIHTAWSSDNEFTGNVASNNGFGLILHGDDNVVADNEASNNNGGGIFLQSYSNNNTVTGNVVSNNLGDGLGYGIEVLGDGNTITRNSASDNRYHGIYLRGSSNTVSGNSVLNNGPWARGILVGDLRAPGATNTLTWNTVSGSYIGIYIGTANNGGEISSNRISNNEVGIWIASGGGETPTPRDNFIFHNDFIDNPVHLRPAYTAPYNILNQPKPVGGNYWSGHTTPDADGDGFVDVPYYAIYEYGGAQLGVETDYLPWASPLGVGADNEGPVTSNVTVDRSVVEVDGTVMVYATVDDSETGGSDIASAEYTLDEGTTWNAMGGTWDHPTVVVDSSFEPASAGVYEVCVRGTDALGNVGEMECTFLVAYDPTGGFVTGGGWIDSPAGAYVPQPDLVGKANFGFVSKYKKGASVPTGNTEFQFKVADLNFKSTSYEWLVIAGDNARYKGEGTINGEGSYKFMLWGGDGTPDTFRIRIWTEVEETAVETDIYDNGFEQALGGGSVVIHKAK